MIPNPQPITNRHNEACGVLFELIATHPQNMISTSDGQCLLILARGDAAETLRQVLAEMVKLMVQKPVDP